MRLRSAVVLTVLTTLLVACRDGGKVRRTGPGAGEPFVKVGTITVLIACTCRRLHVLMKGTSPDGHVEVYERDYEYFDWVLTERKTFDYARAARLTVTVDTTAESGRPGAQDCEYRSWIFDSQKGNDPVSLVDRKIVSYSRSFFMKYTRIPPRE